MRNETMRDGQEGAEGADALDSALTALRHDTPAVPLRTEDVWYRIAASRASHASPSVSSRAYMWIAACALIAVGAGAVALRGPGGAPREASRMVGTVSDPLLQQSLALLGELDAPSITGQALDSLQHRNAMLLAAARAAADVAPTTPARTRLLQDLEYVFVQVANGGAADAVERELTVATIRSRRLVQRIGAGGAE